jgi:hypothetical protein
VGREGPGDLSRDGIEDCISGDGFIIIVVRVLLFLGNMIVPSYCRIRVQFSPW